ncbi:hypothetical protein C8K38_12395 [Rhodococcus sp. OK611]|uniref:hypothetical protein n=1 Tax=unclassified Rhodococcus (in: high G+C Gram-positive bacteria) TaxID=192944 RepID=UPI000BCB5CE5|nr:MULTISPECIES: hypothetical protein [unclassified Rhodococcus (in: high G+C Gram-positive bacteria)]PTR36702.1 hypothetical protein C8K38_12395 [Rhodococcus sp. OK611]SNX93796.1 hypothetical protein SAMN05447004_12395 [Rhodococcus sp. OK270]
MGEQAADIFVDLAAAHRLTCHSIHRLVHLGQRKFYWQEETLTEILLGHMTGVDYTVNAICPECGPSSEHFGCSKWESGSVLGAVARTRLLSRYEEGGNARNGVEGVGADFLFSAQDSRTNTEARLLIQAKRIKWSEMFRLTKKLVIQRDQLRAAARRYHAAPYYLFYCETDSPHQTQRVRCANNLPPQDTAAILLHADELWNAFESSSGNSLSQEAITSRGHSLLCLHGCDRSKARDHLFDTLLAFINLSDPNYIATSGNMERPSNIPEARVSDRRVKPPRDPQTAQNEQIFSQSIPSLPEVMHETSDVLLVRLGPWKGEDDSISGREGYGWRETITKTELRDSTRMYWRLKLARAKRIQYIVAWAENEPRAFYAVKPDSLVVHNDRDGRISFDVDELDDNSPLITKLTERAVHYVRELADGARNSIGYP